MHTAVHVPAAGQAVDASSGCAAYRRAYCHALVLSSWSANAGLMATHAQAASSEHIVSSSWIMNSNLVRKQHLIGLVICAPAAG